MIADDNGVILLDGGSKVQSVYTLKQSINISNDIDIVSYGTAKWPIITADSSIYLKFPAFQVISANKSDFLLQQVIFENIRAVSLFSDVNLTIRNCEFRNSSVTIQKKISIKHISLRILYCKIYGDSGPFTIIEVDHFIKLYVEIFNSTFLSCNGHLMIRHTKQCKSLAIKVINSQFYDSFFFLSGSEEISHGHILVDGCIFNGSSRYRVGFSTSVRVTDFVIKNTHFDHIEVLLRNVSAIIENNYFINGAILSFHDSGDVTIADSHFLNNNKYRAISLTSDICKGAGFNVTMTNCTFADNKSPNGGAISCIGGIASIHNCTFINNKAAFGGHIYSSCNMRISNSTFVGSGKNNISLAGNLIYSTQRLFLQDVSFQIDTASQSVPNMLIAAADKEPSALTIIADYVLKCPNNSKIHTSVVPYDQLCFTTFISYCIPCELGRYSLVVNSEYLYANMTSIEQRYRNCLNCPTGGICDNGIRSKDNYWGYFVHESVKFVLCPAFYCCSNFSSISCTTYNTCGINRIGTLCGSCEIGFSENLFSTECKLNKSSHSNILLFWFVSFLIAIFYAIIFLFFTDIITYFKSCCCTCLMNDVPGTTDDINDPSTISGDYINFSSTEGQNEQKQNISLPGLVKIVFFFYQIEFDSYAKEQFHSSFFNFGSFVSSIFNIKLNIRHMKFDVYLLEES